MKSNKMDVTRLRNSETRSRVKNDLQKSFRQHSTEIRETYTSNGRKLKTQFLK